MFPGPTILSTAGTVSVPYASAATACAPPTRNTLSTPATAAAASTVKFDFPSGVGATMTISGTPATFAGTAFISTEDGYAAVPPGTYMPTRSSGVTRWPSKEPYSSLYSHD